MSAMFYNAESFDQNLESWDVSSVGSFTYRFGVGGRNTLGFLQGAKLSPANYDALLLGWAGLDLIPDLSFIAYESQYTPEAEEARQSIIDEFGWSISDGGLIEGEFLSLHVTPDQYVLKETGESTDFELVVTSDDGNPVEEAVISIAGPEWVEGLSEPTNETGETIYTVSVPSDTEEDIYSLTFTAEKDGWVDSAEVNRELVIAAGAGIVLQVFDDEVNDILLVPEDSDQGVGRIMDNESNIAYFPEAVLAGLFDDSDAIERIELREDMWSHPPIGHMKIKYDQEDFNAGRQVRAELFVHREDDLQPEQADIGRGWKYYQDSQHPVSMIVPPSEIDTNRRPVVFVHGVTGSYPYWDTDLLDAIHEQRDVWEFYYPYDQRIDKSGPLLKKALTEILDRYPAFDKAEVVAHSMGGLVSRSYIQSNDFNFDVRKLLMLGTPNHGSHGAYRLAKGRFLDSLPKWLTNHDENAPAQRNMAPGSDFIVRLNSNTPRVLSHGIENDYLVVAGTEAGTGTLEHSEVPGQHDLVVSVSSASLANYNIPIVTFPFAHSESSARRLGSDDLDNIASSSMKEMIKTFLDDLYETENISESIPHIDSAWIGGEEIFSNNSDFSFHNSMETGRWGMISMRFNSEVSERTCLSMEGSEEGLSANISNRLRGFCYLSNRRLQKSFNDNGFGDIEDDYFLYFARRTSARSAFSHQDHLGVVASPGEYSFTITATAANGIKSR